MSFHRPNTKFCDTNYKFETNNNGELHKMEFKCQLIYLDTDKRFSC